MKFDKFTLKAQEALATAQQLAMAKSHTVLTPLHLLSALCSDENGLVIMVLKKIGANISRLKNMIESELGRLPQGQSSGQIIPDPAFNQIVLDAQLRAVDAARGGMAARNLDAVARSYIKKMGYGKFFPHSLGHGIGLDVHEAPRISWLSKDLLLPGNVVTIEPGVYKPGLGGVRIEDTVIIRENDCSVLNRSPKELLML